MTRRDEDNLNDAANQSEKRMRKDGISLIQPSLEIQALSPNTETNYISSYWSDTISTMIDSQPKKDEKEPKCFHHQFQPRKYLSSF